ncbi:hypothetical protein B0H10DRAFT_999590 [Mycena sp. CBHHK59/15]|nr:hypothetical protein B0H10DRAFT_999590 [Mycena sp. CBHHK59/15]
MCRGRSSCPACCVQVSRQPADGWRKGHVQGGIRVEVFVVISLQGLGTVSESHRYRLQL